MSSQLRLTAYGALATITTSLSLLSVFSTVAWLMPVVVGVIVVAGICAAVRSSPLPSAFEPILAALGVLIWVTILDAREQAHFGFVPGRLAFRHLGHIARNGFTEIHRLPTPAPPHPGLVLLTVIGVSAIALVVDLLTVTLRRAALAGLPLLALFTVSAATGHHGVGVVAFVVGAAGYLWLLYADNRDKVARWGAAVGTGKRARPASAWSTDPSSAPAPATLGRQVGAVAICVGVVVPLLIPGLHTGIGKRGGGGGGGSGSGTGGSSVQTFNPIVKIGADLATTTPRPVLSYRTSTSDPGYLRLTSLGRFDGNSFTSGSLTAPASSAAGPDLPINPQPSGTPVTTTISMSRDTAYRWLPVPSTVLGVFNNVSNQWRFDPGTATVFSATTNTSGLRYTARSAPDRPTGAQLAQVGPPTDPNTNGYMTLPASVPQAVRTLTHNVISKATSSYQAALDIERFFTTHSRFTYDTTIPADNTPNALAHFLLTTRRGFCQQFATGMAVMARLSGIPARVAVGFTRGKKQPDGSWLVTTHDAHAWPELWFQGFGWLAFEPTPRADGQAVPPPYAQTSGSGPGDTHQRSTNNTGKRSDVKPPSVLRDGQHQRPGLGGLTTGKGGHKPSGSGSGYAALAVWVLVVVAAIGLIVPGSVRAIVRQRRWHHLGDPARGSGAAWVELRDSAVDLGAPWDDDRSPRQVAATLLTTVEPDKRTVEAMSRLVRYEERSRYSATPDLVGVDAREDVITVRSAIAAKCRAGRKARAILLPRSTLQSARAAMSGVTQRWHNVRPRWLQLRRAGQRVVVRA